MTSSITHRRGFNLVAAFLLITAMVSAGLVGTPRADAIVVVSPVINEFVANHTGTDTDEFVADDPLD